MKKILSMGALGLVLACSTSVGALGAERPENGTIKTDMINAFLGNKDILNYNLNGNTVVSDVVNTETIKDDADTYVFVGGKTYPNISAALSAMQPNETIGQNASAILKKVDLDGLLKEIKAITTELKNIENADGVEKYNLERDIAALIKEENPDLTVNFGKNINGKITMSILKENQIILQLNSGNAYTINKALDGSKLEQYAKLLQLFA